VLKLIDIRPGEGRRAVLAFVMLLLAVGAYTVVKTVRDALFLSKFGVTQLSFIAIGLAVATSFIVSLYLRLTAGVGRNRLIGGTNVLVAASLAAIWIGLGVPSMGEVLPWVLYIWSSVFGVFIVMQFWLLANDLFDAREAKRLFGFVGAGAILGGVSGGLMSNALATVLGTRSLLLVAGGMLLGEAVLANLVWPLRRDDPPPPRRGSREATGEQTQSSKGGFATLLEHRYVGLIALALLMMTMTTTLLDWQFKGIVKAAYANRTDEMASYFGTLYAYLSVVSFGLQVFVTGWVLRRFGVSVALLLLPISLLLGSSAILGAGLLPQLTVLAAASGAKIAEGGLRFAIDKASIELMWMPVPPQVKEQGKAFVDTVMDRLGTGLTGLLWLGVAFFGLDAPERIHLVSIAVFAVGLLWLALVLRARKAYVGAFRDMLTQRQIDLAGLRVNLMDAEARRTITQGLESADARELQFSLYLLSGWSGKLPDLSTLLEHDSESVVLSTLELLTEQRDGDHRRAALTCLYSSSEHVRRQTIVYLRASAPKGDDPLVEELAQQAASDPELAETTIDILSLGLPAYAEAATAKLEQALGEASKQELVALLDQLGAAVSPHASRLLLPYLAHPDSEIVSAALDAAGTTADPELVPPLIAMLDRRATRPDAALALQQLGALATEALQDALQRRDERPYEAACAILRILGAGDAPAVAPQLLGLVEEVPPLRMQAVRALVRLGRERELPLDRKRIETQVKREIEQLYRELLFIGGGSWATTRHGTTTELLERVLRESVEARLERLLRMLALIYGDEDIRNANRGLRSPLKGIRAGSLEFLDNLLAVDLKQSLLPLLEDSEKGPFGEAARRVMGLVAESRDGLLARMLDSDDPWRRAIAAHCVGAERREALRSHLAQTEANSETLQAIVQRATQRLDDPQLKEPSVALTTIEKALKLQTVDVLKRASTEDLAYVAQIAAEEQHEAEAVLYGEGDSPDALYVVLEGSVRLHRGELEIAVLDAGEAFGSWALVDDAPRVASATTVEPATVLKVDREEFLELLADRVDIVQAVFKAMVERLRILADVAKAV
jgi:AAA family ATP:ADP antiporter